MKLIVTGFFLMIVAGFASGKIWGQAIFQQPLSSRIANYEIDATLKTAEKKIVAKEILRWKNQTAYSVNELQFHLYMNAFRNKYSTFMKESKLSVTRTGEKIKRWGGIDIRKMEIADGADLTAAIEFIHPDDDNEQDSTVIRVALPEPIPPGGEIELNIDFEVRLPQIIARTGANDDYYFIGQWFPKIGVLQENGEWNTHQFHRNSEFFADYGVYEVRLTLPPEYVIGATGVRIKEEKTDSTRILYYRAEDVHDFAWTAWPDFQVETREMQGVKVTLLYDPEHRGEVNRYFQSIDGALRLFGKWFMPYPYPNLTIVDPPLFAMGSAGMEYPTLITGGTLWGIPKSIRATPEEVTIHEFGHQYFYGILGSNEFEEAWLDEGFNSYATAKAMSELYGRYNSLSDFLGIQVGDIDFQRKSYIVWPERDIIVKPAWKYEIGGYSSFTYAKPTVLLLTLENYLGQDVMDKIMKTYFQRFKFKHPTTRDFINIVNEIAPQNMDWFFDQALFDSKVLDYEVRGITRKKIDVPSDTTGQDWYENKIILYRKGEFIFPVEVQVVFSDSDTVRTTWDGRARYEVLKYKRPAKAISARIDPDEKILLDVNLTNNSYTFKENNLAFRRHNFLSLNIYQTLLYLLSF